MQNVYYYPIVIGKGTVSLRCQITSPSPYDSYMTEVASNTGLPVVIY